jgi:hypothetical protein
MAANKAFISVLVWGSAAIGIFLLGLAGKFWLDVRATLPEHIHTNIKDVAQARTKSRFLIVEGGVADPANIIRYAKTKGGRTLEADYYVPLLVPPAAPNAKPAVVVLFSADEFEAIRQSGLKFDSVKGVIPPLESNARSLAATKLEETYGKPAMDKVIFLTRTDRSPKDLSNTIMLAVVGLLFLLPVIWKLVRRAAAAA